MRAYSKELPQKVVQAVEGGRSKSETARLFGISLSSVKRYARLASQGESLAPRKGGGRPPIAEEATKKLLEESLPGELRRQDLTLSEPTLRRLLKRMGFSRKRTVGVIERDEFLRAAWRVTVAEEIDACRLVFVDEMGTNTSFPPLYAWASKAERGLTAQCPATVGLT
jgi:transposase